MDKIVNYVKAILYPFVILAAIGFILTLMVHLSIWAGYDNALVKHKFILLAGIPAVWLPTALVFQLLTKGSNQKNNWKVYMRECPKWMKYMSKVFFIYAFICFLFMLFGIYTDIKSGGSNSEPLDYFSLSLSGFCLMIYSTAMSILYSARKILEKGSIRSCPNGHPVALNESFCPYCGEKISSG